MTNQSASQRLAMPISPRHEKRGSLSVALSEVTIEQHHRGLLSVKFRKWANTAAGYAKITTYEVVLFTNTQISYD